MDNNKNKKTFTVYYVDPPKFKINFLWMDYTKVLRRFTSREDAVNYINSLPEPDSGWYEIH